MTCYCLRTNVNVADLLSLKTDVNIPAERTVISKKKFGIFFIGIMKATDKKSRIPVSVYTDPRIRIPHKMSLIRNTEYYQTFSSLWVQLRSWRTSTASLPRWRSSWRRWRRGNAHWNASGHSFWSGCSRQRRTGTEYFFFIIDRHLALIFFYYFFLYICV